MVFEKRIQSRCLMGIQENWRKSTSAQRLGAWGLIFWFRQFRITAHRTPSPPKKKLKNTEPNYTSLLLVLFVIGLLPYWCHMNLASTVKSWKQSRTVKYLSRNILPSSLKINCLIFKNHMNISLTSASSCTMNFKQKHSLCSV